MPTSSHNSFLKSETDYQEDLKHNLQSETVENTKNWYYGTEELLDALPKAWTRSVLYMLAGFAVIVLPWTMLSKVDEVGSARGRIEPLGATQKLDFQAQGRVIAVNVTEGQTITQGQVLMELESDLLRTQLQQELAKLEGQKTQLMQLKIVQNQLQLVARVQEQQNQAQKLEKEAQIEQAQQNLDNLTTTYSLQKEEQLAKVKQAQQTIYSSLAAQKLAQVRLEGTQEKVPRYKKVFEKGAIAQDRYLEVVQSVKENYQSLLEAQSNLSNSQSRLQEQQSSYQKTLNQARSDIQQAQLRLGEQKQSYQSLRHTGELALLKSQEQLKQQQRQITDLKSQIAQITSQVTSLQIQLQRRTVRSPIDGVLFSLPIQKPGVVVQPGQLSAEIAPKNSTFILKAHMPNQQSGFLKVGMPVKLKFDAYPFQDYGIIRGHVRWIAPDSKIQDTKLGKSDSFALDIVLDQHYIQTANKRIPITPGQTATAEVIVRQRRIIDYILDPFKKLQKGGLEL